MRVVSGREQLSVSAARAGDAGAWDALFRRYQLPLYAYVRELLHDDQTALDVVQETFINAARHLAGLRTDAKFGSWLFGIAHQKVVQRWRKPDFTQTIDDELESNWTADDDAPDDALVRREQTEEFMKLLGELPPVQREALLLHYLEDFSLEEIAGITAVSVGTVKSRLHYGKRALRQRLEERTI